MAKDQNATDEEQIRLDACGSVSSTNWRNRKFYLGVLSSANRCFIARTFACQPYLRPLFDLIRCKAYSQEACKKKPGLGNAGRKQGEIQKILPCNKSDVFDLIFLKPKKNLHLVLREFASGAYLQGKCTFIYCRDNEQR